MAQLLLVGRDPAACAALRPACEEAGLGVIHARTGAEALALLRESACPLVVLLAEGPGEGPAGGFEVPAAAPLLEAACREPMVAQHAFVLIVDPATAATVAASARWRSRDDLWVRLAAMPCDAYARYELMRALAEARRCAEAA